MKIEDFFIDLRTDKNIGIPVLIKKTKQLCVKNVFAIPYYDIAKYISNAGGYINRDGIKSYSQRLKNVICDVRDLYSIEAVLKYHKKSLDDCKDYWVGWFNPYSRNFENITDIYGNTVAWTHKVADEILEQYESKYFCHDHLYFVSQEATNRSSNLSQGEQYLRLLDFLSCGFAKDTVKEELSSFLGCFLDDSKITEVVLLNSIHSFISNSYSRSLVNSEASLDRKYIVWNLFRSNATLMFKKLLRDFGVKNELIGSKLFMYHFKNNTLSNKKSIYTEQLYRCIAISVAFFSIGVDLKKRVDEGHLLSVSNAMIRTQILDEDEFDCAIPRSFADAIHDMLVQRIGNYGTRSEVLNLIKYLVTQVCFSPYMCYDSEIFGCYRSTFVGMGYRKATTVEKYINCTLKRSN